MDERKITSPESTMITSTAGRSPDPFETFSVAIKDKTGGCFAGDVLSTNQSSRQSPCPQELCRRQPAMTEG
jgi:hypothetical protein